MNFDGSGNVVRPNIPQVEATTMDPRTMTAIRHPLNISPQARLPRPHPPFNSQPTFAAPTPPPPRHNKICAHVNLHLHLHLHRHHQVHPSRQRRKPRCQHQESSHTTDHTSTFHIATHFQLLRELHLQWQHVSQNYNYMKNQATAGSRFAFRSSVATKGGRSNDFL